MHINAFLRSFNRILHSSTCDLCLILIALIAADRAWPKTVLVLSKLHKLEPSMLVEFAETIVDSLPYLLDEAVPRKVQTMCCSLWFKLNTEIPRR